MKTVSFTNQRLKTKLQAISITEEMFEAAFPGYTNTKRAKFKIDSLNTAEEPDMTNLYRLKIPKGKNRDEVLKQLKNVPEILYAEPNGTVMHCAIPSDTRFSEQWALRNNMFSGRDIHAVPAWDIYKGNPDNIIAVIDGGSLATHEDLNEKITGGDTGYGWDGHGIHVSGIAAAESNNAQGISGVDWYAKIHPQRIDNLNSDVDTYQAIVDAVNYSPRVYVLNNSWGAQNTDGTPGRYSTTLRRAFAYAYKANRTSVAAMGNHQQTRPDVTNYPAGFGNIIAVGATDNQDVIAGFSVHGSNIDVCAPGVGILSTVDGGYANMSGTSMATPHVSGIASLLKGYNPNLANDDIENIIKLSADTVRGMGGANYTTTYGFGRVNAERALSFLRSPYRLSQWTATSGQVSSTTDNLKILFMDVSGLSTGTYIAKRHEVRKTITYPEPFLNIVGVWGRGAFTSGFNTANPNFGEGFCEVVPGTATTTGVTLRTYVYELYDIMGSFVGYCPAKPANVSFAYSVLGTPFPSISGPSTVCEQATYTIENLPPVATVQWSASNNNLTLVSGQGTGTAVFSRIGNGSVDINTNVNVNGTNLELPSKLVWCGLPLTPTNIKGFNNGKRFAPNSEYTFFVTDLNNPNTTLYLWNVVGGSIEFQSTNFILVITDNTLKTKSFSVTLTAYNNCGQSSSITRTGIIDSGLGPFKISPNPATTTVSINLEEDKNETATRTTQTINNTQTGNYQIQLWNSFGMVKQVTTDQKNYQLDLHGITKGFYYIHVIKYGKTHRKQLIVK